jgi:RNA polymerase sigma factor, sigma-70 family
LLRYLYRRMNTTQFNNIIWGLSDKVYRLAKSILRNENLALDAVQDLNMKLWEKRNELDGIENITGFVIRSMRNLCLDKLRKMRDEQELTTDLEYKEANPYTQLEQKDMMQKVKMLIDSLPELQKTVIRMRDVEELEINEIAEITSLTENAVRVNLSRARQKIREQLLKN